MNEGALPLGWGPREPPLRPAGVVARGMVARALARRLLAREDAELGRLHGAGGPGVLVLLGDADALPWEDGVTYLGRDADAPALLLPSNRAPDVPVALLERALLARARAEGPLAVLLDPPGLVPLGGARAVVRARLEAWLQAEERG
ncbi:MAG TPA: hypothetical protein VK420_20505 [Longimicrobium sp.]|nr:hypothetical protein [Longimicrobium sp.]